MSIVIPTRWVKIIKDIWSYKSRSILVVLSIAVGVAAVGMINNAAIIIQHDLYGEYAAGNPAQLEIYAAPFPKELATAVSGMREVKDVQARRIVNASISTPRGSWQDLELHVVPDYNTISVNQPVLEQGSATPGVREIVLERQSAGKLALHVDNKITVKMPDDRVYTLAVVGVVQDVYVMPISLLGQATGYISMDTLEWLGQRAYYNRLDIITNDTQPGKSQVLEVGDKIRDRVIVPAGYAVGRIGIPGVGSDPGQHWAQNQIKGFLLILEIMGVLAVFLSSGLVVNTISAILSQQIKQIGIMRSFGAGRHQIISMYLVMVVIFSILGLLFAFPLGLAGAWGLSVFAAGFLNFNVAHVDLPLQVILLQLGLGLLMPLGVALFPVISGTRISVYEAIYQYGLSNDEHRGLVTVLLGKIRKVSPPLVLSFRNTFRKKARLVFTLVTLTLAGAMFIAAFSTRSTLTSQINDVGRYIYYDASIEFPGGAQKYAVQRVALRVPGVSVAESWATSRGVIVRPDGSESQQFELVGLPYNTVTIQPLLLNGAWLQAASSQQVVINSDLLEDEPGITVGSQIELKIGDRKRAFTVTGIASKHLSGPRIYMDYADYEKLTGRQNEVDLVRVLGPTGKPASSKAQDQVSNQLKQHFKDASFATSNDTTRHVFLGRFTEVFNIILIVLVIMAVVLAIVGGLGLAGAMGMNVLERTREIGVLRAVGASNFMVRRVVVVEGLIVGFISWMLGVTLSAPSGWALASAVIYAVLKSTPRYHYSVWGMFIWLAVVLTIGVLSSLMPALNASRLRVREVLDYE
jgi:putative ABC transport system permease protein